MVIRIGKLSLILVAFVLSITSAFANQATDSVRPNFSETVEQIREENLERLEEKRVEIDRRREDSRARWEALLDERRADILELIEERIAAINDHVTDHFLRVLARLEAILDKIESHATRVEELGADISSVTEAVATAQSAIDAAEVAVNSQKEKVYALTITDEQTVGDVVRSVMDQLKTDLAEIKENVEQTRGLVHDAAKALREVITQTEVAEPSL